MIVLQVFLWILFALVLLICLALWLKISVRLKYGEQNAVILGIGFIRINLTKLKERREKRKKKPKLQKLAKSLPETSIEKHENQSCYSVATKKTAKETETKSVQANSENKSGTKKYSIPKHNEKKNASEVVKNADVKQNGGMGKKLSDFVKGKSLSENLTLLKEILVQTSEKFSRYASIKVKKLTVTVSCPDAADTAVLFGIANGVVCSMVGIIESFRAFSFSNGAVGVYQDYVSGKSSFEVDITFSMRVFRMLLCLTPTLKAFLNNKLKSSPKETKTNE